MSKNNPRKEKKSRFSLETVKLISVSCVKSSQSNLDMLKRCRVVRESHINARLCLAHFWDDLFLASHVCFLLSAFVPPESLTEEEAHETCRNPLYRKEKSLAQDAAALIIHVEPSSLPIHLWANALPSPSSILGNDFAAKSMTNPVKLVSC